MKDPGFLDNEGRKAGLVYLALALTGAFALAYMPSQIMVKGDAGATITKLLARESLFRWSILSQITSQVLFIFLVLGLARLFRHVEGRLTHYMVALVLVSVPMAILLELFSVGALLVAKGEWLPSLAAGERIEMAFMMLRLRSGGLGIVEVFWGLWLIPFGVLVIRSGMIPRVIGYLLIAGGLAYVLEFSTALVAQGLYRQVIRFTPKIFSVAELGTILWLLVAGTRHEPKTYANG